MKRPETAQETFLYQHQQYKRKIHFLRIFIFVVFLVLWELAADLSWIKDFYFQFPETACHLLCANADGRNHLAACQHHIVGNNDQFCAGHSFYHSDCSFALGKKICL